LGQVDAFAVQGVKLWFNSSDHLPPHLHAKRQGEWEIRVFFLECTEGNLAYQKKWGRREPSHADRTAILSGVLGHRVALLEEWEQKVCKSN
jgi:hypothetical protein